MSDSLRDTFFAECEDLLDALSEGLVAMEEGVSDDETVNAIFRSVHSIKGAAGAFGMTDLVNFAHKFETVLDGIRSHTLNVDDKVLRIITRSGDCLALLVEAAQAESGETPESMDGLIEALVELSGAPEDGDKAEEAEFEFEAVAFAPIELDLNSTDTRYSIQFTPERALFDNGHEPAHIIAELARLGELTSTCDTSRVPELVSFDPEESYLGWEFELVSQATEGEVRRVFEFVDGLCSLDVERFDQAPEIEISEFEEIREEIPVVVEKEPQAAAVPPSQSQPEKSKSAATPARPTLRVDPERVDRLINTVGELIINQAVITQKFLASGIQPNSEVMADLDDYRYLAREIQEGVMAIRAQPVKPLFQRMGRVIRESADSTGKNVQFVTEGDSTEVDKTVVERLADPLTHMIRNAVDHGIESREKRIEAGKPEKGTVKLSAAHRSGNVLIEITDDGAGLNRERIFEIAVNKELIAEDAKLSDSEIDNLLFMPGFSTAEQVTNLSGRGVGMDVVKTAITSLGGRVSITSTPGKGSVFSISLPLTLAVLDGMVVTVGGETMVLPLSTIVETIKPKSSDLKPLGTNGHLLSIRGNYVPVIGLGSTLEIGNGKIDSEQSVFVLIQTEGSGPVALAVDAISDQRQVVIKSLEGNYRSVPGISAATILGDGKIALIVDTDTVVALAGKTQTSHVLTEKELDHDRLASVE